MSLSLAEWLARLGVEHPQGVLGGLQRAAEVAARADVNPPAQRSCIVAGTNGKGSTCLFLEQLLLAAGRSVGTTLSPHLERFNERIRLDGREAEDDVIVAAFAAVERARGDTPLSYFEYAVLAALQSFRTRAVDVAVLEVGLGGRLDATNIVDADVAIVVSIGLDHQAILGDTCEAIGVEKAGVMRRGKPVVFGAGQMPDSVRDQAARLDAPLLRYGRDYDQLSVADGWQVRLADGRVVRSTVAPQVPAVNAAAALQAFALLEPQFEDGAVATACRNAFAPGRLERVRAHDRLWLLDVGHNGQAARFLAASLRQPAQCAIVGMFEDKDHVAVAAALSARVRHWIATNNCLPRGLAADELARRMAAVAPRAIPRLDDAVAAAIENTRKGDVILAFGSFDIVARVRAHLLC